MVMMQEAKMPTLTSASSFANVNADTPAVPASSLREKIAKKESTWPWQLQSSPH